MNDKLYTDNLDNPFLNIQSNDRRMLLRILYPNIDYDLIFYPEMDNEELLDDFGLPRRVSHTGLYIFSLIEPDLIEHLHKEAKKWLRNKYKE